MPDKTDFNILVDEIVTQDGFTNIRPVVEKEMLHYDILYCLAKDGLLRKLTFQRGMSLRLCYAAIRNCKPSAFLNWKSGVFLFRTVMNRLYSTFSCGEKDA
ncbi:hypothetical protein [Xenorhabdus sp. Sc-CR9]|uniref:hypothetical protein n=1 Tax=Xenorhabdus sp. Sc-CR9 TaxID=2584468 RepID=UPI001F377D76|nr:hypothetical protein [Xenorhabdus sp. Sc-CR9]